MKNILKLGLITLISSLSCSAIVPYVGGGVGYLIDGKDPIYSSRVGAELLKTGDLTHSVEAEILFNTDEDRGVRLDVMPFMANYRMGFTGSNNFYGNVGAGLGVTIATLKYLSINDSDKAFTYQLLGTVGYQINKNLSMEGTFRYLNIGTAKLSWVKAKVGDDCSIELGLRYKF